MWDLVGNPEDRFFHHEAHIIYQVKIMHLRIAYLVKIFVSATVIFMKKLYEGILLLWDSKDLHDWVFTPGNELISF